MSFAKRASFGSKNRTNNRTLTVQGLDDVKAILLEIMPRHANNLLRATVHGMASHVAKRASSLAPKERGRLKKAIKSRRRKSRPQTPIAEVYVNRGTSRDDPKGAWYWHFVEYGTQPSDYGPGQPEQPYIRPAKVEFHRDKNRIVSEQFTKKLNAKIKREQKAARSSRQ
jgi:HK97 gp10 family phage protein